MDNECYSNFPNIKLRKNNVRKVFIGPQGSMLSEAHYSANLKEVILIFNIIKI